MCSGLRYWHLIEPATAEFSRRSAAPLYASSRPEVPLAGAADAAPRRASPCSLRFGRPWPLPAVRYGHGGTGSRQGGAGSSAPEWCGGLLAPTDCRGKTAAVAQLLRLLPARVGDSDCRERVALRFVRGVGPVALCSRRGEATQAEPLLPRGASRFEAHQLLEDGTQAWWPLVSALRKDWRVRVGVAACALPLDEGVAAADRAEVLSVMGAAKSVPSTSSSHPAVDAALEDGDSAVNSAMDRSSGVDGLVYAPGTGQFYYTKDG